MYKGKLIVFSAANLDIHYESVIRGQPDVLFFRNIKESI